MGLKIMSNTNIRKPRLCLTTQSTTMMQERGMFTSRPMLMFAQPHKESNSKNLTTTTSYMGCRKGERSPEFEIRGSTSCNCTWRRDTSLTLNLLCLLGCVGLTASGSEMLMSWADPRSNFWDEGIFALPVVPTNTIKAQRGFIVSNKIGGCKIWASIFSSSAVLPMTWLDDSQSKLVWRPSTLNQGLRTLW